ncbi:nucleoside/nucleotide kinase family protein [Jiella pelagia]|uniref:Uncharacterized protein n=1 Tax=Jiella pelagia TaxID=2986949 RepID=A0ABY7BYY7_9HYPH|nr:hypothetical protein [Jiella pelagia]WAP69076.1 hypothetical protein OH818_01695 [Jiella pelagia]
MSKPLPTITISGPCGVGKTVVAFAIQTMMRKRFGAVTMIEGDTSGRYDDMPELWEARMVKAQGWIIREVTQPGAGAPCQPAEDTGPADTGTKAVKA